MSSYTKNLISALAITFLDNFGLSIVFILFAPLILNPEYGFFSSTVSTGSKNLLLGILIGVFPFFLFFGAPFWGDIGDLWGRKQALVWTILGTILGHLLTAAAIVFQSYLFLLVARAFSGFLSGNVSICLATISDISPDPQTKGRNFGLLTVFLGMGWILAMLVGGYLSDPTLSAYFSPALPFFLAALMTFLGYLIVQFLFVETGRLHPGIHFDLMKSIHDIQSALQIKPMRPFLYVIFFWSLGWFSTFQWFTPVSLERYHVSQELISSHLLALGICWIIGGVVLNPLFLKKYSSRTLSIYSVLFLAIAVGLCGISSEYWLFSFFFAISALAGSISLSNILNEVATSAPLSVQGKAMGFAQSFQALAGIIVPFAGGMIANLSIAAIYPLNAALLVISFLLLWSRKVS